MDLNEISKCINDKTTLLLLENPHLSSGHVVPIEKLRSMYKFAKENNLNVYIKY
jgi:threonine aldolase